MIYTQGRFVLSALSFTAEVRSQILELSPQFPTAGKVNLENMLNLDETVACAVGRCSQRYQNHSHSRIVV